MLSQDLIEDDDQGMMMMMMMSSHQMGLISPNPINLSTSSFNPLVVSSSFALDHATSTLTHALLTSTSPKPPSIMPHQLLSPLKSSPSPWAWEEEKNSQGMNKKSINGDEQRALGVSTMTMKMKKKIKGRRKVREPRFCFKTLSDVDVLDDGYKWRKYGQKVVKNTLHPRSYYRCTQDNCRVKKKVERLAEDPRMVITTYEGRHAHSPSHDLDASSDAPHHPLLNNFFR